MSPISRRSFFGQATAGVAAFSSLRAASATEAQSVHTSAAIAPIPELRVAILGDPDNKIEWTDSSLEALKKIGFNAIQLNIAWGNHVHGEPLNLIDVVTVPGEAGQSGTANWQAEIQHREGRYYGRGAGAHEPDAAEGPERIAEREMPVDVPRDLRSAQGCSEGPDVDLWRLRILCRSIGHRLGWLRAGG